ncbi:inositol monophosphatase family protein [Anaplasma marginale]|uniref:inositol monophosphatase family protein n=1 Tax=Anaplasma marginale TaxID=770 RepID=UPI000DEEED97|nr:inositol monophosphatase family protein [Anaplasma marginale]AXW83961.1 extragenic suppressor protein suhB (suhB) [Anaplasma marginale]KAA8473139.1 inositol monophosphatase family protein [Anaplasma marginale]KAB0451499.1 inositol monophosphatase family protein [Anaplasma marginale]RCL20186.1 inositol monophosphatase family protein [Anaplasma marginale]
MSALFSPVVSVMLRAVRKSSKGLVRDFNEIRCLQPSHVAAGEFAKAAYIRSSRIISEELYTYKQECGILFDDADIGQDLGELFWFVSPIDSRTNFTNGLPYFATVVALVKNGEVTAAVVDAPVLRETFYVDKGLGAFVENYQSRYARMHVAKRESIKAALVDVSAGCPDVLSLTQNLVSQHAVLRSMGSVTLGFAYAASACYDMVVYSRVHEYKARIGRLFIEGSKGSMINKDGMLIAGSFFLCDFVERNFLR